MLCQFTEIYIIKHSLNAIGMAGTLVDTGHKGGQQCNEIETSVNMCLHYLA